jgi:hypothetical protein
LNFSLSKLESKIKDTNKIMKNHSHDNSFLFLVKQHSRTLFITFVFLRLLEDELTGKNINENLQGIILNALDYIKKNFKSFYDILVKSSSHKSSKKDINSNPFSSSAITSRNGSNKENYGGASNT